MHRLFPVFIVCAVLSLGGCAHTKGSSASATQDNSNSTTATEQAAPQSEKERRLEARRQKLADQDAQIVMSDDGKVEGRVYGKPAKGSKFTKLRIGMSKARVDDMIGPGTDTKGYTTGKAFIPFYHGRDGYRIEVLYRGSGRLAFSSGQRLVSIVHDANEDGYND